MLKQRGFLGRKCVFFLLIFLFVPVLSQADDKTVVINEIAWMGTENSANDEWIELYNSSDENINLESWKIEARDSSPSINLEGIIEAKSFFLLERSDDTSVSDKIADQIYTGAMSNSGEFLELFDASGAVLDLVDASTSWPAGENSTKHTMERQGGNTWVNSQSSGGSPREANSSSEADDESEDEEEVYEEEAELWQEEKGDEEKYRGKVLINEIVSDPTDDDTEWIELFNKSIKEIDLSGWYIEEGGGERTVLDSVIGVGEEAYLVIINPAGRLDNDGDSLELRDSNDMLIDSMEYGNWQNNSKNENAQAAIDPYSLARYPGGKNSGVSKHDFVVSTKLSKGKANTIKKIESSLAPYSELLISELLPNPRNMDEFIEIYNQSEVAANLKEWLIANQNTKYNLEKYGWLKPGEYLSISRSESDIVLSNQGACVYLYKLGEEVAMDKICYETSPRDRSLVCINEEMDILGRVKNKDCLWSEIISKDETNKIKIPNRSPMPDFSVGDFLMARLPVLFDSSDTIDLDGDELEYSWDFGDGFSSRFPNPDHIYAESGEYDVVLEVSDGEFSEEVHRKISIFDWEINEELLSSSSKEVYHDLIIEKFMPNPEGLDSEGEWIEILNSGEEKINMLGWSVDDKEGGSRPYVFEDFLFLDPGGRYLLSREDSGLALNNNIDEVRLIAPDKSVVDLVAYNKVYEGQSYFRNEQGEWQWSMADESKDTEEKTEIIKTNNKSRIKITRSYYKSLDLEDLEKTSIGEKLKVKGRVAVEPGVFSSQYFYIVGSPGLQIYSYKKDFPDLRLGDELSVSGELSEINGEKRLKISSASDISIISSGSNPDCQKLSCQELEETDLGTLVELEGEVLEKKSSNIYIFDGSNESHVYVKKMTGIDISNVEVGDQLKVRGILSMSKDKKRVLPRYQEDITILNSSDNQGTQVLGTSTKLDEWSLKPRERRGELIVFVVLFFLLCIMVGTVYYLKIK